MVLQGGKLGSVPFSHHLHQNAIRDCNICHTLFPQIAGSIEKLKAEEEENVSVVVIGSHGKSCISEMLLGSVSEKVIRKSSKPVLVVRR